MLTALWLLVAQGTLGAFDTLYYHEYKLRLPAQPHARHELKLHALRDFVYAALFGTIGWRTWNGLLAWICLLLFGDRNRDHPGRLSGRGPHAQTAARRTRDARDHGNRVRTVSGLSAAHDLPLDA